MKHRLIISLLGILFMPVAMLAAGNDAAAFLRKVSDRIGKAHSLTCEFIIISQGNPIKGSLLLSQDRFHMTGGGIETWYDGVTQWTLSKADNEVTIIEPTPEELQQINPFAILSSLRNAYTASFAKVSAAGTKTVVLHAKSSHAQLTSAQIVINEKTLDPVSIELMTADRRKITIHVSSVKSGGEMKATAFCFNKSKFPGVTVNDMR